MPSEATWNPGLWTSAGGDLPSQWSLIPFGEFLESPKAISVGVMYPGDHFESGTPLIRVGDVQDGGVVATPQMRITTTVHHEYRRTELRGDELLVTLVGKPGVCVIARPYMRGWNVARALAVARIRNPKLRPYLKAVLESSVMKSIVSSMLNTTVQPTLNLKEIRSLPVPVPCDLNVATAIGQFAEDVNERIDILRQTNATLESVAQALFKSWFIDFDPVRAKAEGREPEGMDAVTAALFPRSETAWQQECRKVRVGELISARILTIGDGYRAKNSELGALGVHFIRAGDLLRGRVTPTEDYLSAAALERAKGKLAKPGDTAFTSKGTIGRFAYVDTATAAAVYSPQVCYWRSESAEVLEPSYLHFWMKSPAFARQVDSVRGQAAIMDFVSLSDQRRMFIDLPAARVQRRFAELAEPLLTRISINRCNATSLEAIRDTLLPRLISGKLRLPEA